MKPPSPNRAGMIRVSWCLGRDMAPGPFFLLALPTGALTSLWSIDLGYTEHNLCNTSESYDGLTRAGLCLADTDEGSPVMTQEEKQERREQNIAALLSDRSTPVVPERRPAVLRQH